MYQIIYLSKILIMKLTFNLFFCLLLILSTSCQKSDSKKQTEPTLNILFENGESVHKFSGSSFTNFFDWTISKNTDKKKNITSAKFNLQSLGEVAFIKKNKTSMDVFIDDIKIEFYDSKFSESQFYSKVRQGEDEALLIIDDFSIKLAIPQDMTDKFMVNFDVPTEDYDAFCPWCIAYGVAALVSLGVDYYCDRKISNGASDCTGQGLCTVVNSCSVTCIECPNN